MSSDIKAKSGSGEAAKQRHIQRDIGRKDAAKASDPSEDSAAQLGAREYPVPPFPAQQKPKPGIEAEVEPAPMYEAPYYKGSEKLAGKVAIITGGDSGIGRAVAVLFAREGADVAIAYLNETIDAETTKKAIEAEGRNCLLLPGDITEKEYAAKAVSKTLDAFGQLDILVNNAAFQIHAKDFDDLTDEHFDTTLKTNLYGYFRMAKAAVPHMKSGSAIVNTGSVTGIDGSAGLVDYSMTKGGIHAFTRALSGNLLKKGIRVNCVAPGPVWTPLNPSDKEPEDVAKFGGDTPMKRPAQPEELAPAYVFLASNQMSSYITGEILPVIGGY